MLGLSTQPTLLRRAGFGLLQNGGGAALAQGEFGFVSHIGKGYLKVRLFWYPRGSGCL